MNPNPQVAPSPISVDDPFAAGCAWIEGEYVPIGEARIPILDTGFVKSDLTYDVVGVWVAGSSASMTTWRGSSAAASSSGSPRRPRAGNCARSCSVSSAAPVCARHMSRRSSPARPGSRRARPPPADPAPVRVRDPVRVDREARGSGTWDWTWSSPGTPRRIPSDSVDPRAKNFHWATRARVVRGLRSRRHDRGPPDGDGNLTEGPGFNVFAFSDGRLYTPSRGVLEGITRMTVTEIAAELGQEVVIDQLPVSVLHGADEIFLTVTAGGVMAVATLDGEPVGDGSAGSADERDPRALLGSSTATLATPRKSTTVRGGGTPPSCSR